jgi:hypothetical protein
VRHCVRLDFVRSAARTLESALHAATSRLAVRFVEILRRAAILPKSPKVFPQTVHRLRKVDVNASIVDEHVVHLEVRGFGFVFVLKVYKGVPEARARLEVANDVARHNLSETTKDDFQIFIRRHRV